MKVVPATDGHFQHICNLIETKEELFWVSPNAHFPLDIDQLRQAAQERNNLSVIIDDGQVIGFANLYDVEKSVKAFIGNVIISKNYRGQGVGRMLINYMANIVRGEYQAEPHLTVISDNSPALLLYSSMGFTPYSVEEKLGHL